MTDRTCTNLTKIKFNTPPEVLSFLFDKEYQVSKLRPEIGFKIDWFESRQKTYQVIEIEINIVKRFFAN